VKTTHMRPSTPRKRRSRGLIDQRPARSLVLDVEVSSTRSYTFSRLISEATSPTCSSSDLRSGPRTLRRRSELNQVDDSRSTGIVSGRGSRAHDFTEAAPESEPLSPPSNESTSTTPCGTSSNAVRGGAIKRS
jgi:hypothetical protein